MPGMDRFPLKLIRLEERLACKVRLFWHVGGSETRRRCSCRVDLVPVHLKGGPGMVMNSTRVEVGDLARSDETGLRQIEWAHKNRGKRARALNGKLLDSSNAPGPRVKLGREAASPRPPFGLRLSFSPVVVNVRFRLVAFLFFQDSNIVTNGAIRSSSDETSTFCLFDQKPFFALLEITVTD
ncbi:unnamed protein product [Soboliphyme baturini]|uniref:Uncharacterized protein n=1 Tax=Soboliphyme baturini TaxID=241478 RepID=A0A183J0V9_9BILA|nr:unnamed protein product [Soboliphyme baturini]